MILKLKRVLRIKCSCFKNGVVVPNTSGSCENNAISSTISACCENDVVVAKASTRLEKNLFVSEISGSYKSTVVFMMNPDCENDEEMYEIGKRNCIFRSILFLALMIGVPIEPTLLFPKRKTLVGIFKKWSKSIFYIRTVFLIVECFYNYMFWPSLALRYSIHGSCLTGYAIVLVFHIKRREVETALVKMTRLSSELHPGGETVLFRCYEFVCFCCWAAFYALALHFFFYTYWDISSEKIPSFSLLPEGSSFSYRYNWMVTFAKVSTYHLGSATLFVTTLLCGRSYLALGKFVSLFGEKLKIDVSKRPLLDVSASRYLNLFNRVFSCTSDVDNAFCIFAFLIYMDVINNFYVLLSTLLSGEQKYRTVEVSSILLMIGLGATLKFFYLTLCGDTLNKRHEALKNQLVEMSDFVVRKSSTLGIHRFTVITANVRTVDIHVTGMGYFKISRLIIPSSISVLISYGVMIYQIGATADLEH